MPRVHDSPDPWITEDIRRFEETGGRPRPGVNDLLLTTRGRRSGELRRTALVYERDRDRYVLAASGVYEEQTVREITVVLVEPVTE
jgi:hypothetical protein